MNRARVHAAIDKQRLLESDQRELLLQGFGNAFDLDARCSILTLTRRGSRLLWCILLKRRQVTLLLTLVDVLFSIGFRMELLLLVVSLWAIELMLTGVVYQEGVLIT